MKTLNQCLKNGVDTEESFNILLQISKINNQWKISGATPTVIANMTAVVEKYGASPQAFLVIPLVGAFFIDIANAFIIKFILV